MTYLASKKIFREIFDNEWPALKLFRTQIFKQNNEMTWSISKIFFRTTNILDQNFWLKWIVNQKRDFLFFLNIKMDQKKSTPKIIWVRQSWNSEIILFRPIIQISICGMKNLNYILSLIGGSDTSQWLEITRLTFLPKYSKSQWAFLRNRWFQKLKK